MDKKESLDWHSAFAAGLNLSLRAYKDQIHIEREYELTKMSPQIDALIIKKERGIVIDNDIGRAFRLHNVVEYKNPNDDLNIDVVYKVIGYAGLYKGYGETVNAIPAEELTITILRARKPKKILSQWGKEGKEIINPYPGVYYIKGVIDLQFQIVVTQELTDQALDPLRILMKNADEDVVRRFLCDQYATPGDRYDADAVLQISAEVNKDLFTRLKGDEDMSNAMLEIMREDLTEAENHGRQEGRDQEQRDRIASMLRAGKTSQAIADFCGYPLRQVQEVEKSLYVMG